MARTRVAKLAFNRGLVSKLAMARADVKRLAFAAEIQTNWVTRTLGSMMLRPGMGYLGSSRSDLQAFHIPFVFSVTDKAVLELTNTGMRVWVNDAVITRVTVGTTVTNGTFDANLVGWTNADEAGATSAWQAGGYMGLTGNGSAFAIERQQVAVAAADQGKEHALHIVINRGPVVLRVGSTSGNDDYIAETELATGAHSLALTPSGASFWVEFKSRLKRIVLVDSCVIEAAGKMVVETPWAGADLRKIRHEQSGDVVFLACDGYQQRRIERRATRSWSVVRYQSNDGPFRVANVSTLTITPSALSGNITLTASSPLFRSTQAPSANSDGAIFMLTSNGQQVSASITGQNQFTNAIRVTGVNSTRVFTPAITGLTATGSTITLQRSLDSATGPWTDVSNFVADSTVPFDDGLDNQIAWYRIGCKTGNFVAGPIAVSLAYTVGSIDGVARITGYTSSTIVSAEVLTDLGGTSATEVWAEGSWSDYRGFPTAVAFVEGRLNWDGRDAIQLSVSDAFDSFDPNFEGDAGPINRTIGSGPVDKIHWALSLQRLLLGGEAAEFSVRSSSFDEPLTPTNFNIKRASTKGTAPVAAVQVDQTGVFASRSGVKLYELSFQQYGVDYEATHLSALKPDIGAPSIVKIVVQTEPEVRLHILRSDGTVAMLVSDKLEQVICFLEIETDGEIEDAVVLPCAVGELEDAVYYSVNRTINGTTKRYFEKWALESEVGDLTQNKQADSFVAYNQAASATIGGLTHLIGEDVVVWDNGKCLADADGEIATFTVSAAGEIAATNAGVAYQATEGVVGLAYSASWKSARLVELMSTLGGSLVSTQMVKELGLILADVHAKGLKYGRDLTEANMRDLPQVQDGAPVDADTVHSDLTVAPLEFPGQWSRDARLCLLAKAPRPATVLAALAELEHHG